jgi:hypothetical protein
MSNRLITSSVWPLNTIGVRNMPAAGISSGAEGRLTKSIRITRQLDRMLKEEAHMRTMSGTRTSGSDLIEKA